MPFEGARPWPPLSGSVGLSFDATKSWKRFLVLLPFRRHSRLDSVDHSVFFAFGGRYGTHYVGKAKAGCKSCLRGHFPRVEGELFFYYTHSWTEKIGSGRFCSRKVTPPGQAARAVFGAICDEWKENYSSTTHTPEPRGLGLGINVQKVSPPAGRRFRLAVEGSWFQTLEAQMEAIKKQVLSRKSSLLSCAIIPRSF